MQLFGNEAVTQIVLWAGVVVTASNAVTASFPSVKDNKIYNFIMRILNFLAVNIKHNKNADAPK